MKWLVWCFGVLGGLVSPAVAGKWETFAKCSLDAKQYFDGDSFQVVTKKPGAKKSYTYVFRLYGVDCPETDKQVPARVKEQAKDFRIAESDVLKWGKKAKDFTRKFLAKPFTVHTKKEKAGGQSRKDRYYCVVIDPSGKRLDEELVRAGLARVYGEGADWPARVSPTNFLSKLHPLESKAKRDKVGIWGK